MRKIIFFLLLLFMGGLSYAGSDDPHVHGEAQLKMVIDQGFLRLDLTLPAESVIGFEHEPRNKDEMKAVSNAKSQLAKPALFTFYKITGFFKKESLHKLNHLKQDVHFTHDEIRSEDHDDHDHEEGHSEFTLTIEYEFPEESRLTALSTQVFDLFNHLETIDLTLVSNGNAQAIKWESKYPKLNLKKSIK